jgi:glycosyltransferase involved in cell wall biosynthesis
MRIALLAPLWKAVPPVKYGGTELVVANLARGLIARGHEVTTFACGGSKVAGKLVAVGPGPLPDPVDGSTVRPSEFLTYFELGKRAGEFDIIHNHIGLHAIALAPFFSAPILTTLHGSKQAENYSLLVDFFKDHPFVSISDAQRRAEPGLNYVATIQHGIDVGAFQPRLEGKGSGFVFIGMLAEYKGLDIAIETALALGVPLTVAGRVEEHYCSYLCEKFFPAIDDRLIRFVGEVDHARKAKLLSEADALLFPSRWEEPFGLVMIEALACGTPVVALGNGSVPEVLRDGVTGFVTRDQADFIRAAKNVGSLSRAVCRQEAEERYSVAVMAQKYEEVYLSLLAKA